jgi:C-terminal processing protease CtpA/Prc
MESKGYRKATADERRAEERRAPGRVGMRLEHREMALIVVGVAPGGPADRGGITVGDRLVKIGGIPVDGQTKPEELAGMITGAPGSKVMLTIQHDNQEKDVIVTREVPAQ